VEASEGAAKRHSRFEQTAANHRKPTVPLHVRPGGGEKAQAKLSQPHPVLSTAFSFVPPVSFLLFEPLGSNLRIDGRDQRPGTSNPISPQKTNPRRNRGSFGLREPDPGLSFERALRIEGL